VDGVLRFALKSLPAVASDAKDPAPGLELGCACRDAQVRLFILSSALTFVCIS